MSFIAGYVDTAVFVGLFGLFTAHVTGNFVLIGSELVHRNGELLPKLLAFPAFVLAVALAVKIREAIERRGKRSVPPLLYTEAALLLAACAVVAVQPPVEATDASALAGGMLAAGSMGLQNALMRLELASIPSTTVMTVNVTQSVIDAVTMLSPSIDGMTKGESAKRFARMWPQIVAFTIGAAGGAAGYAVLGLAALLIPSVLCAALAACWHSSGR